MRVALIYSGDGLDIDVLYNLIHLYKRLNFSVIYSKVFVPCHLLILPRPTKDTIIPEPLTETPIHIYNYVGNDITEFFLINKHVLVNSLYICTSSQLIPELLGSLNDIKTLIALPPVYPQLWRKKRSKSARYPLIHIGNLKPYIHSGEDQYANNFLTSLRELPIQVWGKGWSSILDIKHAGTLEVTDVSDVYAKSDIALGLMYPFQRDKTFSGRFWHGPLNGCAILSEPNLYGKEIPGVYSMDLSRLNVEIITNSKVINHSSIQEESSEYWSRITKYLEEKLSMYIDTGSYQIKVSNYQLINYYRFENKIRNLLRNNRSIYKKFLLKSVI